MFSDDPVQRELHPSAGVVRNLQAEEKRGGRGGGRKSNESTHIDGDD